MGERRQLNFTKAAIDALSSASGWTYFYDTKVRGLAIGVGQSGTKTFMLYRKVKKKPERLRIGRYPDLTVDEARRRAAELNGRIAIGDDPAAERRARLAEMTFGMLFTEFYEKHSKVFKKTHTEDQRKFELYLSKQPRSGGKGLDIAAMPLSQIDGAVLSKLYAVIAKEAPVTANRVLALVSSVFGRGIAWGYWPGQNPCRGLKRVKEHSRDRFLRPEELKPFFAALRAWPDATTRDYFLLSLFTGARRSNVLAMRWEDVDLEAAVWTLAITKNGAPQTIPLVKEVIMLLRARERNRAPHSKFVLPGSGATGHLTDAKKAWQAILRVAGIKNLRIHDLRRSLGSWQAGTGASTTIIGRSLNHKSTATTAVYARLWDEPVRAAMGTAVSRMLTFERGHAPEVRDYGLYLPRYASLMGQNLRYGYSEQFWRASDRVRASRGVLCGARTAGAIGGGTVHEIQ